MAEATDVRHVIPISHLVSRVRAFQVDHDLLPALEVRRDRWAGRHLLRDSAIPETGSARLNPLPDVGTHILPPTHPSDTSCRLLRATMSPEDSDVALEKDPSPPGQIARGLPPRDNRNPVWLAEIRRPDFSSK